MIVNRGVLTVRRIGALALVVWPSLSEAQSTSRYTALLGLGVGTTQLPTPLVNMCGGNGRTFPTIELVAGITRGAFRIDARGAAASAVVVNSCKMVGPVHENGVHTDVLYPYERNHGDASISLHAQYALRSFPATVGIGAGRLMSAKLPYYLVSAGLRAGGRVQAVIEAEARATRLHFALVTREWLNFSPSEELQRITDDVWHEVFAVRLRMEYHLR